MDLRPKTIFCDIDGTLVKHELPWKNVIPNKKLEILDGTIEKFSEWDAKGYYIINDNKPDGEKTAFAINIKRNIGIKGVEI